MSRLENPELTRNLLRVQEEADSTYVKVLRQPHLCWDGGALQRRAGVQKSRQQNH